MNRDRNLTDVRQRTTPWDIVVIGGGATGAGCALDAASRGFEVLLLEQHDFGKGTSSRSTKLIHGGVRYLRQGNISLVREALKERGLLLKNAPHVVHGREFVIPCYRAWEKYFYGAGMKLYDALSGEYSIGRSQLLSFAETIERLPSIAREGLSGGVLYRDGQFDDARFLVDLIRTARSHGAAVLNYARVDSLDRGAAGRLNGLSFTDIESNETYKIEARTVINAAGAFCDAVRHMSDPTAEPIVTFAQGIHIVLDRDFLPAENAVLIPKTSDGRVLFCVPWHDHLLVGTTDTPVRSARLEPMALDSEIDFVLAAAGKYLARKPRRPDVLSVFAGIRPLIASGGRRRTSALSRGHDLFVDSAGLVTITGGKWTTYRRMAEDAVDRAVSIGGLSTTRCRTEDLAIRPPAAFAETGESLHGALSYTSADVIRAAREEMARTVEDVLARRTRALFLNARAAMEMAPPVAAILARELKKDTEWERRQVKEFRHLAADYSLWEPAA